MLNMMISSGCRLRLVKIFTAELSNFKIEIHSIGGRMYMLSGGGIYGILILIGKYYKDSLAGLLYCEVVCLFSFSRKLISPFLVKVIFSFLTGK